MVFNDVGTSTLSIQMSEIVDELVRRLVNERNGVAQEIERLNRTLSFTRPVGQQVESLTATHHILVEDCHQLSDSLRLVLDLLTLHGEQISSVRMAIDESVLLHNKLSRLSARQSEIESLIQLLASQDDDLANQSSGSADLANCETTSNESEH